MVVIGLQKARFFVFCPACSHPTFGGLESTPLLFLRWQEDRAWAGSSARASRSFISAVMVGTRCTMFALPSHLRHLGLRGRPLRLAGARFRSVRFCPWWVNGVRITDEGKPKSYVAWGSATSRVQEVGGLPRGVRGKVQGR